MENLQIAITNMAGRGCELEKLNDYRHLALNN